jgi:cob(I)alamin adenosyltransferase
MTPDDAMQRIDNQLSHVWMVRQFLKHAPESEDDEQLRSIQRELYDYMLALGGAWKAQDAAAYLKQAHKKFARLRQAAEEFAEIQPEVSTHTNFEMAARSLRLAVAEIGQLVEAARSAE